MTEFQFDIPMLLTFLVILVTIILYALERYSIEAVSLVAIVAFTLIFTIFPTEYDGRLLVTADILAGFANPALITVVALLIAGQALFHTNALDKPVQILLRYTKGQKFLAILVVLVVAGCISAVTNNTPVVVMFLPILVAISTMQGKSPAMVLMPLSFISILGGMTTLIGSSTNLLVAEVVQQTTGYNVGFFTITPIGVAMAAVGAVYIFLIMPIILKPRMSKADDVQVRSGKQFIVQMMIDQHHPLSGMKSIAGLFPKLKDITVRLVQRGNSPILPPFEDLVLQPGDAVVLAATRNALKQVLTQVEFIGDKVDNGELDGVDAKPASSQTLSEAVVAPGSRYKGRKISDVNLQSETGCAILGIQRRNQMPRTVMTEIRLEAGDVLLLTGAESDIRKLRNSHDLLLLDWSTDELPLRRHASRARWIFGGMVALAASGLLPIVSAVLLGCAGMLATGCLNVRQAIRAIDSRIFMLIGTSLAAGVALEATEGTTFIAGLLFQVLEGQSPVTMLSILFLLVAALTNVLSNNATAVILSPIAIEFSIRTGLPLESCIVCLMIAANCAFATPIGYQTNLIVLGPGHYQFSDFVKAGLPLVLLIWIAFTIVATWYFGI